MLNTDGNHLQVKKGFKHILTCAEFSGLGLSVSVAFVKRRELQTG